MDDIIDSLQIRIERAKAQLPEDTLNAIAAVDWKAVILGMRTTKGYTFEQLGDLELETELLLCGLVSSANYPRELENRMKITKIQANELVNDMNKLVFAKIREELIKNTDRKKIFEENTQDDKKTLIKPILHNTKEQEKSDMRVLNAAGIKIIPKIDLTIPELEAGDKQEKPAADAKSSGAPKEEIHPVRDLAREEVASPQDLGETTSNGIHPILAQKFSGSFKTPTIKTEYSLNNITKINIPNSTNTKPKIPNADPYREIPE